MSSAVRASGRSSRDLLLGQYQVKIRRCIALTKLDGWAQIPPRAGTVHTLLLLRPSVVSVAGPSPVCHSIDHSQRSSDYVWSRSSWCGRASGSDHVRGYGYGYGYGCGCDCDCDSGSGCDCGCVRWRCTQHMANAPPRTAARSCLTDSVDGPMLGCSPRLRATRPWSVRCGSAKVQ